MKKVSLFFACMTVLSGVSFAQIPSVNLDFKNASVTTQNDEIVVSTGKVTGRWKWTGKGLVTTGFKNLQSGKEWVSQAPEYPADWDLRIFENKTDLISVEADISNDENFTSDHLRVVAEIEYAKGKGSASTNKKEYSHDLFTKEALAFVEKSAGGPFFLYLAYTIPHTNNEYRLVEEHGMKVPDYGQYANKDWPNAQKGLAAMITYMDKDMGVILNKLKELGIDKNTLLIFSSDNGPHKEGGNDPAFFNSSGGLRGHKRDLYEGGIREPMIAYWPGTIEPGQTSDHISGFQDFSPTACEVAGVEAPENIDGISYLPELLGEYQPEHKAMYWEFISQGGKQAVRKGKWKLVKLDVLNPDKIRIELFDLETDRSEQNDVSEKYPEVLDEMKKLLKTERTESEEFTFYPLK